MVIFRHTHPLNLENSRFFCEPFVMEGGKLQPIPVIYNSTKYRKNLQIISIYPHSSDSEKYFSPKIEKIPFSEERALTRLI